MVTAIIQARMESSRLPGKVLQDLGGYSTIEMVLKRTSLSKLIDQVCVASPKTLANERLAKHVESLGYRIFFGSEHNVLERYYKTAKKLNAKVIVRITADCPFIDPEVIDDCVKLFYQKRVNYLSNNLHPTFPDGLDVEVFDFSSLEAAYQKAYKNFDLEHVTPFMRTAQSIKRFSYKKTLDTSHLRWTLDEPEDLILLKSVYKQFRPRIDFSYKEVENYVISSPHLLKINNNFVRNEGSIMSDYEKQWRRAKRVIPGGNMLLSKRPTMFHKKNWPTYYSKARGCSVWDLAGKKYLDFSLMGVGTNILGYGHSEVDEAVKKAVNDGNMSTLNSFQEVELAERLIDLHPWSEMAKFARSGGEINAVAIRIARAATGRTKIAFCGYHGWHDWYLSANLQGVEKLSGHLLPGLHPTGVPEGLADTVLPFEYNKIDQLKKILQDPDVGTIMMEVERNISPQNNFLNLVRELANKNNAVLIFDECTSGFRENFGGLHLKHGVVPDLATFGKALGNGYAITALVGKKNVMEASQETFISSTFWTERIGFAAGLKTLDVMSETKSWEKICEIGDKVSEYWRKLSQKYNFDIEISGLRSLKAFNFEKDNQLRKTFITQQMLKRDFLASNSLYSSISHTENLVEKYFCALGEVFEDLNYYLEKDQLISIVEGDVSDSTFKRLN